MQLSDRPCAQMRLVLCLAGGVDHQEQMAAEIRHHQVVENAAGVIGELGVALSSRCNAEDVLRHQPFQRQRRILELAGFRPQRDLAHMRDVEQAGGRRGYAGAPGARRTRIAPACRSRRTAPFCRRRPRAARAKGWFSGEMCRRAQASRGPRGSQGDSLGKPVEAPSVAVPESIIPSADTSGPKPFGVSFQMLASHDGPFA